MLHYYRREEEVLYVVVGILAVFCDGVWTIYDAPPGTAGRRLLGRFNIPSVDPGAYVPNSGALNLQGLPAATTGLHGFYVEIDEEGKAGESNAIVQYDVLAAGSPLAKGSQLSVKRNSATSAPSVLHRAEGRRCRPPRGGRWSATPS